MLIDDFEDRRLLVIGDVMLDHFIAGAVERVSPEAPALVLRVTNETSMLGGAGNVAANIAALGANAVLVGVVGDDAAGDEISGLIGRSRGGIVDALVRSAAGRTTEKSRYIAGDRHLLRADREASGVTTEGERGVIEALVAHVRECDAVVISDYAKGVITRPVVEVAVREAHRRGIPVIADPKRRDFTVYAGADVLTPNTNEIEFATGIECADLVACGRAADQVQAMTHSSILLTRSEHGVAVFVTGEEVWTDEARATAVRDVSGAGDTILAVCSLALAAGAPLREAAHVANNAAAVAVGKSGTASITRDELSFALLHSADPATLAGKLMSLASARSVCDMWRSQGLEIGVTNGCFDLLHPGHIRLLSEARSVCDRLIVALNTDASVRRLKGPSRPVQSEAARAAVIGAVRSVDLVMLFDEDTPLELIRVLKPDVLIKGGDYTIENVVGADIVRQSGGRVELVDLVEGQSSTKLIDNSRSSAA